MLHNVNNAALLKERPDGCLIADTPSSRLFAEDFNPNHLPAGAPDGTGGQFRAAKTSSSAASGRTDENYYLKDAIKPANDPISLITDLPLSPAGAFKSGVKIAAKEIQGLYGFSKEAMRQMEEIAAKLNAKYSQKHAFANVFEKKGHSYGKKSTIKETGTSKPKNQSAPPDKTAKTEAEKIAQKSIPPVSEIRLRSSLQKHDEAGGHMLKEHSPRNDQALRERYNKPNAPETASCFDNDTIMHETVNKALKDNAQKIRDWLANPYNIDQLQIDVKMRKNIGRSVKRNISGSDKKQNARFILKKDANMDELFHILTGFPR